MSGLDRKLLRMGVGLAVLVACGAPHEAVMVAQPQKPPITWSASPGPLRGAPGEVVHIEVSAAIGEGWHLYSLTQTPPPDPTVIAVPAGQPFSLGGTIEAPVPQKEFDEAQGVETEYYSDAVTFGVPVASDKTRKAGEYKVVVTARWQACNGTLCLRPQTATLEIPVQIVKPGADPGPREPLDGVGSPELTSKHSMSLPSIRLQYARPVSTHPPLSPVSQRT